jgi:hypothetical protein
MNTSARLLVPITITTAMLGAGTTLPEPATAYGESAWVSAGTYVLADLKTYAGVIYKCASGHTGRTTTPNLDPTYWVAQGPTRRMAPFDDYTATVAAATGTLTYVINASFPDGINIYNPKGAAYSITVKDAPGGTVTNSQSGDLYAQAAGFAELLFSPLLAIDKIALSDIDLSPTAEITITLTNGASGAVSVGDIKVGSWRLLKGAAADFGGAQYGASSERKTYTSRKYNDDGTYTTVKRGSYRDVRCQVVIDAEQAMYADAILAEIADVAVPFEASGLPRYGYLSTLGFVSASMSADNFGVTTLDITIKGNI